MKRILLLAVCLCATAWAVDASVLVLDTFTNPDPITLTDLENRTPEDVNVPGNDWLRAGGAPAGSITNVDGRAVAFTPVQIRTSLGGLNVNTQLMVSASLRYEQVVPNSQTARRGAGVGFSSGAPLEQAGFFVGLVLGPTGEFDPSLSLKLINNLTGSNHGGMLIASLPYTGTRTGITDYHDLSYLVNTSDGSLTRVVLDGDTYDFGPVSFFTGARTEYFAFYNDTNGDAGAKGYFDFVQVEAFVPEPSTTLLLLTGGGILWRRGRRESLRA